MIKITYKCRKCDSQNIKKNGFNRCGNQQYYCKDCHASQVLAPKVRYTEERKEEILKAYQERGSMRGIRRIYGVSLTSLSAWLKKKQRKQPELSETLIAEPYPDDVLEVDEMWSFVGKKKHKRWLWLVICRRTRQIVAFFIGDRSEESAEALYARVPAVYKRLRSYSDLWDAYKEAFPYKAGQHRCVDKSSGETNHIERFNLTVRQRLGRYVRKTLSFSKSDYWHALVTKWFIIEYNQSLALT